MRDSRRAYRGVCLFVIVALLAPAAQAKDQPAATIDAEQLAKSVTIYRDGFGTPHIDGPTDESVIFGFAYCQAEDFFWQLEDSYAMGLGRYAELYGQKELPKDMLNRAFEVPQRSREDFGKLDAETQDMCSAFVAGLNHYLKTHPETKPRIIERFEPWHMLAFVRGVMLQMGFGHTGVSSNELPKVYPELKEAIGSNQWAIGPSRTKSGKAMLFVNPHQPYYGFGQFYEGHLRSGEGWNFTGATFFGSPLPTLGHNEHLGWAFTVNEPHTSNAWIVKFDDPQHPLNYRYGDGYRQATQWKDKIKVKKGPRVEEQEFTFRKTHYGPIVKQNNEQEFITVGVGKFYDAVFFRQNLHMVRARNLQEFRAAVARNELHIFNTMYADREGNIWYAYNGIVPKRKPGFDQTKPLDGANPDTEWQGYHTLDEFPQMLNPASGYMQNCNSTPFTTADDGNPAIGDFPEYMVRDKHDDKRRAKVSRLLLRDVKDLTYEKFLELIFDTTIYWAVAELPKYREELQRLRASDTKLADEAAPYLAHLLDWDGKGGLQSTQATLCLAWYEELYGFGYPAETLKAEFVGNVPAQFQALVTAAGKLKTTHGDWKIPWGDINRLQRHTNVSDFFQIPFSDKEPSLPSAGMHGPPGVAFTMYFSPSVNLPPLRVMKKHYAVVGASYISAIEFGERIQSRTLVQYGASSDPKSPHFFDQAELLSKMQLKPPMFYWEDVKAGAKRVYHPGDTAASTAAK